MTTLKEHLFTKKSGIRHFVILGITALIFGIYCILAAKANPTQWFTKSLNDSQQWKLFIMAGLLLGTAALQGIALYWSASKLTVPYAKKAFLALWGWLPCLHRYDSLAAKEKEEQQAREERRQWDRENPIIVTERYETEDYDGNIWIDYVDVVKNPVQPVREETKAFFKNALRRVFKGAWALTVALGVPLVLVVLSFVLFVCACQIQNLAVLAGIVIGLLTLFAALFVVYPVLALTKNAAVKAV